jgi:hypothetical protein
MSGRVKRVKAAEPQYAVDGDKDWVVVKVIKSPIRNADGKVDGFIRTMIIDRPNKDLPSQPEAASGRTEIDEGTKSEG